MQQFTTKNTYLKHKKTVEEHLNRSIKSLAVFMDKPKNNPYKLTTDRNKTLAKNLIEYHLKIRLPKQHVNTLDLVLSTAWERLTDTERINARALQRYLNKYIN